MYKMLPIFMHHCLGRRKEERVEGREGVCERDGGKVGRLEERMEKGIVGMREEGRKGNKEGKRKGKKD